MMTEPVAMQYARGVVAGEIVACKWVRLACERHLRDLDEGSDRGLHFSEADAQHAIDFFGFLKHSKGEWAGQSIVLEPWQQFLLWVLFGWQKEDGTRRFRTSYLEVSRKNGKTTLAAGLGLYLMIADGEPGAEVYAAATKRDQAKIAWSEAMRMVQSSSLLRERVQVYRSSNNLSSLDMASKFEPLGRDTDSMDGLNVHAAIVDEVHAHKTRETWDLLDTATGSRRQPLMFAITTAGFDRQSLCYELHDYTEKVLQGTVEDDSFLGLIFTLDEGDDPDDESNWPKANPNLGVSKKWDDMRRIHARAQEMPSALNSFLRLHLDVWTQSVTKWMNLERWNACAAAMDADGMRGRRCYGGLDLSNTTDITAFVLVFPPEIDGDPYQILCRFWVPEANMRLRSRRDRVPYDVWVRQGYITATPGDVIDYKYIYSQFDEDAQKYDIIDVAFDRWGATKVYQDLEERGAEMIQFGQGYASMSSPMKELEKLVLAGDLGHGGNPVLTWMAENLVAREDPAGNIKPDKEKSTEKIDGMVALIMGLDRALRHTDNQSVYEERELRTL